MLPQAVQYVLERLEDAGFAAYAVGGCVHSGCLQERAAAVHLIAVFA